MTHLQLAQKGERLATWLIDTGGLERLFPTPDVERSFNDVSNDIWLCTRSESGRLQLFDANDRSNLLLYLVSIGLVKERKAGTFTSYYSLL